MIAETPSAECPAIDSWFRLLREDVSAIERDNLEQHLEGCGPCRDAFVDLAGDWSLASHLSLKPSHPMGANTHAVLARLITPHAGSFYSDAPTSVVAKPPVVPGLVDWQEIGRGGMGIVFRARQVALDRFVAVKVLSSEALTTSARARAVREGLTLARLRHPNIVAIYGSGEADGLPFLVMEWVDGGTLQDSLDSRDTPFPPREAATLMREIARAVGEAHSLGIIHRDLKPANILLTKPTEPNAPIIPKLADFGLARSWGDGDNAHVTETGVVVGTPNYMAPEQTGMRGSVGQVGPATDVHGLGAILHALLTGKPPYGTDSKWQSLLRVSQGTPDDLRTLRPDIPRDLETIVARCLETIPSKRYRSAGELADDLQRFLEGRPVLARPIAWPERLAKLARRRPVVATATVLFILSTITALCGASYHFSLQSHTLSLLEKEQAKTKTALDESKKTIGHAVDTLNTLMDKPIQTMLERGAFRNPEDLAFLTKVFSLLNAPLGNPESEHDALERAKILNQLMKVYARLGLFDEMNNTSKAILKVYSAILAKNREHDAARSGTLDVLRSCLDSLSDAKRLEQAKEFGDRLLAFEYQFFNDSPAREHRLTIDLTFLAKTYHFGNEHEEAVKLLAEALKKIERLRRNDPKNPGYLTDHINQELLYASLLTSVQRIPEAITTYDHAQGLVQEGRKYRIDARTLDMADLHAESGIVKLLEADSKFQEALPRRKRIIEFARRHAMMAEKDHNIQHIWNVTIVEYHKVGERLGLPKTGLEETNELIKISSARRAKEPSIFVHAISVMSAYRLRAEIHEHSGNFDQAVQDGEAGVSLGMEWIKKPEGQGRICDELVRIALISSRSLCKSHRPDLALKHWERIAPFCINEHKTTCENEMKFLRVQFKLNQNPQPTSN